MFPGYYGLPRMTEETSQIIIHKHSQGNQAFWRNWLALSWQRKSPSYTELAVSFDVYSRQSLDSTISQYNTPHCGTQSMRYILQVYCPVLSGLSRIIVPSNFNTFIHFLLPMRAALVAHLNFFNMFTVMILENSTNFVSVIFPSALLWSKYFSPQPLLKFPLTLNITLTVLWDVM